VLPYFHRNRDAEDQIAFEMPPRAKMKQFEGRTDVKFLNSTIKTRSAEERDALGRSGTYQFVHASEAAYWPKLIRSLGSLLACCHDYQQTVVILETTANGMNAFQTFWNYFKVGKREVPTLWRKIFVPWYWDDRYEMQLAGAKHEFEDEYEAFLYKLILEDKELRTFDPLITADRAWAKLFWRRRTMLDKCLGDDELFRQEFPATDLEAFMFSGESAFDPKAIRKFEQMVKPPIWRGNIRLKRKPDEDPSIPPSIVEADPHPAGAMRVWEKPILGEKYAVAADIAEGKASEGISEDKSKWDYSCAQVVRITSYPPALKQVAVWHGNCDPDLFGDVLVAISRTYNEAFLSWEINGPGRSIGMQVVEKHRYRNIYMRREEDSITHRETKHPGWKTTRGTKPDMVAVMKRFVRALEILIFDEMTLGEMKAFSRVGQNQWEAAHGHDDRVIAMAVLLITTEAMIGSIIRQAKWEKELKEDEERRFREREEENQEQFNPALGTEW
jgi:hypothetical protein